MEKEFHELQLAVCRIPKICELGCVKEMWYN